MLYRRCTVLFPTCWPMHFIMTPFLSYILTRWLPVSVTMISPRLFVVTPIGKNRPGDVPEPFDPTVVTSLAWMPVEELKHVAGP